MKRCRMLVIWISLLFCLAACSTNTPRQNQVIGGTLGAGAGAALGANSGPSPGPITLVGVGAIVGLLIGSSYGNYMEESDRHRALQAIAAGKPASWKNPHTQVTFRITPSPRCVTVEGNPHCRQFTATQITTDGQSRHIFRTACLDSHGRMELVH